MWKIIRKSDVATNKITIKRNKNIILSFNVKINVINQQKKSLAVALTGCFYSLPAKTSSAGTIIHYMSYIIRRKLN